MPDLTSAGLLVHRRGAAGREFLLVHPGGPYWRGKDEAAWSIPKGLVEPGESLEAAARREFREETGFVVDAPGVALASCRTPGRKTVHAWLVEADVDVERFVSASIEIEWPPRSGRRVVVPEVDEARYFGAIDARRRLHRGLRPLLDEALARLGPD